MQGLATNQGHKIRPPGNKLPQSSLVDIIYEAPYILDFLDAKSRAILSGSSKHLKQLVHSITTIVVVNDISDVESLVMGEWPCLVVVIVAGYMCWKKPAWPKHGSLQLLTVLDLSHAKLSTSAAAFVVAAKPNQRKQERPATLFSMITCQVSKIWRLTDELLTRLLHSRRVRKSVSQSKLHQQRLATAVGYLSSSPWQQPFRLEVLCNGCGAEGIAQLSTISWSSVEHLCLSRSCLDAAGIAALVKGSWSNLSQLDLSGNRLDIVAVTQLVQGRWPKLWELDVSRNRLDNAAVAQLAHGQWPLLSSLVLSKNYLVTADGVATIVGRWPLLSHIELLHITLSASLLSALSRLHGHELRRLELVFTKMTSVIMSGLAQAPLAHLRSLQSKSCNLGADSIAALTTAVMPRLETVYLNSNKLDAVAATLLANADWPLFRVLCLSENHLNNTAMACLAQKQWSKLNTLYLDRNDFDIIGIECLKLQSWPALSELMIPKNMLCAATWQALDLPQSEMLKLILGKAGYSIQVKREIPTSDTVWPQLRYITFQSRSKVLWYRSGTEHVAYFIATHLLTHVCLYLMNLVIGNLPVARLAFALKDMNIALWQDATSIVVLLGHIPYIFSISLLFSIFIALPD